MGFDNDRAVEWFPLAGERITIGRSLSNDFCFPGDPTLSRSHLVFEKDGEAWTVRDLGSKNGTLLNGLRLTATHPVHPGDRITAGRLTLVCRDRFRGYALWLASLEDSETGTSKDGMAAASLDGNEPRPAA